MSGPFNPMHGVIYATAEQAALYFSARAWIDTTIAEQLRSCAREWPERAAFVCDDVPLTFAALDEASERLAGALRSLGLQTNDRALFQMGTVPETVVALFGCFKAGVVPVCTIPQYRELEIAKLAQITRPSAYFVQADCGNFDLIGFARRMCDQHAIGKLIVARGAAPPGAFSLSQLIQSVSSAAARENLAGVSLGSEDVAVLQLSGGSTGVPKVIPRFHAEYLGHVKSWCDRYGMQSGDVGIWALPLLHNAGMMFALLRTVLYATTTVLVPQWDVRRFFDLIQQWKVNHAFTIGPHAPAIAAFADIARHDLSSLRFFFTLIGAEAIERATGVPSTNMFGITEGLVLTGSPQDPASLRHGTVGCICSPLDEVRVKRFDSEHDAPLGAAGELCFRGPSSLRGYYDAPEISAASFTSDGFFRTGDVVRAVPIAARLAYRFEGRIKDNINRGGEKFGTEDIEQLIARHPLVADGKVVAMPDPIYGEKACAFLIPSEGRRLPTLAELGAFLLQQGLAKYKLPERIEPIDAFPTTRVGKLDRVKLREMIAAKIAAEQRSGERRQ